MVLSAQPEVFLLCFTMKRGVIDERKLLGVPQPPHCGCKEQAPAEHGPPLIGVHSLNILRIDILEGRGTLHCQSDVS